MAWPKLQSLFARSPVLRYGLAATSSAFALGLALLAQRYGFRNVEVPLFLFAIVVTVWYAGIGPTILALVLSSLGFDYFFTEPHYSFYLTRSELPHYAVFILFAFLLAWFATVRRRAEAELLQARDELEIERKRVGEVLRQNETYLAEAQHLSHTGSFGWKPSTGAIIWSEETFRIFQYDRTTTPTVELILQRIHPEDTALVQQTIERATQEGKDFSLEHRLMMPDGSIKHLHVVARALNVESGTLEFAGAVMDVTERKRAAEALLRSEVYLAEGQKLSHTGTWACNIATREMIHSSDEHQRLFGLIPRRVGTFSFEEVYQRIHPDDRGPTVGDLERAMCAGTDVEAHFRVVLPEGTTRYMYGIGHPLVKPSGETGEFVGTVMDVTERKLAEEALRQSESYLAEAQKLTHTGSGAWRVPEGDAVYLSEEWYRIYGFDQNQGLSAWNLRLPRMHPEDRAKVAEAKDRATSEKADYEVDHRILLPDGTLKYTHTVGHPVLNASGEVEQFVCTMMDITDRTQAEALREGENRILEMIARDAPLGEILESLVRVVEAQFAGLLCSVLLLDEDGQRVRHGAAPNLPQPYSEAIDGLCIGPKAGSCGTAMYRREPVIVTDILDDPLWEAYRDVAEPYGLRACWSTPILSHSGKALGSFAMYYREPRSPSPSETRALEMATHLAGIAIERTLAREERERLREAQADLAHINRVTTMGELTASLAHEIKQPISAAVTDARSCMRWLERDAPDVAEAREAAARIVKDAMRAADVINSISLLFKKGALQRELVDVNELIREMIVLLRSEAARHSISIRSDLAEDIPRVMADRVQLQQVFMNLMLNGIDAMKDVSTARELTIRSQRVQDGQLTVSVSDTGIGLPLQQSEQIFSAFFTTKAHGTGMGLPISRSIIESHGGRLWATSNSERGASFHFSLPSEVESRRTSAQHDVHPLSA
jgi:PAS domain S-box-containing protein